MATLPIKLEFVQGDTISYGISWIDSAGSPTNLTGATITASVKKEYSDTASLVDFSIVETDLTNGQFSINLTSAQTAGLTALRGKRITSFVFDVNVQFSDASVKTPIYGYLNMQVQVT